MPLQVYSLRHIFAFRDVYRNKHCCPLLVNFRSGGSMHPPEALVSVDGTTRPTTVGLSVLVFGSVLDVKSKAAPA